jgi:hypothetical protein
MTQPAVPPPTPMNSPERRAFLWKILDRYDLYIGSTISRAAAVTALNTLVVGYVILKAGEILGNFGGHTKLKWVAFGAVVIAGLAAFVSTLLSFLAVAPYLGGRGARKKSIVFFADVARKSAPGYVKEISALSEDAATVDVAEQVHDVATGLSHKFARLKHASRSTLVGLAAMLALGASVMISTWMDWMK